MRTWNSVDCIFLRCDRLTRPSRIYSKENEFIQKYQNHQSVCVKKMKRKKHCWNFFRKKKCLVNRVLDTNVNFSLPASSRSVSPSKKKKKKKKCKLNKAEMIVLGKTTFVYVHLTQSSLQMYSRFPHKGNIFH